MKTPQSRFQATLNGQTLGWYDTFAEAQASIEREQRRMDTIFAQWLPLAHDKTNTPEPR